MGYVVVVPLYYCCTRRLLPSFWDVSEQAYCGLWRSMLLAAFFFVVFWRVLKQTPMISLMLLTDFVSGLRESGTRYTTAAVA